MKLPIPPLGQRSPLWARKKLGTSSVTIGSAGCVLTCMSMLLKYYGHEQNPDILNEVFKSNDIYHNSNLVYWWGVPSAFPDIKFIERYACYDDPCDLSKIDEYLDKKMPVIAEVDFSTRAGLQTHFVLIIGKDEQGEYLINDPYTGECYFFSAKYGDPARYIYGLRLFTGPIKEDTSDENKIKDLENKVKNQAEQILELSTTVGVLDGELTSQEQENTRINKSLIEAREEKATLFREKENLEREVAKYIKRVLELNESREALRTKLRALEDISVEALSASDLFSKWLKKVFKRG